MWLRHAWTVALFVGGGLLLVVLPYGAIVQSGWLFWIVVAIGILVSFICASSELAFGLACGEGVDSRLYKTNLERLSQYRQIADDDLREQQDRSAAAHRARRLELLIQIGENYASRHNPTLVVTNNVATILVAVVSGVAIFKQEKVDMVGQACAWIGAVQDHSIWAEVLRSLPPIRCVHLFGALGLPFPVSANAFQSAFALTLILVLGEMIPKQLGTAFPEQITHLFYPLYRIVALLSLGTGPSFGLLSRSLIRWFKG